MSAICGQKQGKRSYVMPITTITHVSSYPVSIMDDATKTNVCYMSATLRSLEPPSGPSVTYPSWVRPRCPYDPRPPPRVTYSPCERSTTPPHLTFRGAAFGDRSRRRSIPAHTAAGNLSAPVSQFRRETDTRRGPLSDTIQPMKLLIPAGEQLLVTRLHNAARSWLTGAGIIQQ